MLMRVWAVGAPPIPPVSEVPAVAAVDSPATTPRPATAGSEFGAEEEWQGVAGQPPPFGAAGQDPAAVAPPPATAPAPAVAEGGAATEERLQAVCAMGFERAAAESALVAANGDVEGAIDLLLNAA